MSISGTIADYTALYFAQLSEYFYQGLLSYSTTEVMKIDSMSLVLLISIFWKSKQTF